MSKPKNTLFVLFPVIIAVFSVAFLNSNKAYATIYEGALNNCKLVISDDKVATISPHDGNSSCTLQSSNGGNFYGWSWSNPSFSYSGDIEHVFVASGVKAGTDLSYLFADKPNLISADISNLDTSETTNYNNLFGHYLSGSKKLESVNLSGIDTSKAYSFANMFQEASSLKTITGIEELNTSSLTTIARMFSKASSLENLDLSAWDTKNLIDASSAFFRCESSEQKKLNLNVSTWDTRNLFDMSSMFSCLDASPINIKNWKTPKLTIMFGAFSNLRGTKTLDLSNWETSSISSLDQAFYGSEIENLNLSNWEVGHFSAYTVEKSFFRMPKLKTLDFSGWQSDKINLLFQSSFDFNSFNPPLFAIRIPANATVNPNTLNIPPSTDPDTGVSFTGRWQSLLDSDKLTDSASTTFAYGSDLIDNTQDQIITTEDTWYVWEHKKSTATLSPGDKDSFTPFTTDISDACLARNPIDCINAKSLGISTDNISSWIKTIDSDTSAITLTALYAKNPDNTANIENPPTSDDFMPYTLILICSLLPMSIFVVKSLKNRC